MSHDQSSKFVHAPKPPIAEPPFSQEDTPAHGTLLNTGVQSQDSQVNSNFFQALPQPPVPSLGQAVAIAEYRMKTVEDRLREVDNTIKEAKSGQNFTLIVFFLSIVILLFVSFLFGSFFAIVSAVANSAAAYRERKARKRKKELLNILDSERQQLATLKGQMYQQFSGRI
jgi:hypothetical protein